VTQQTFIHTLNRI